MIGGRASASRMRKIGCQSEAGQPLVTQREISAPSKPKHGPDSNAA